jgi:hypothetical protein
MLFQEDGGKTFDELEELENYDSSIDDVEEEYDSAISNNSGRCSVMLHLV